MSVSKNYYIVAGYDLTEFRTKNYNDWKWTEEGEELTDYHSKGHIQFFDDPCNGIHLYFGYILASGDEYNFETVKFDYNTMLKQEPFVRDKLKELIDKGVFPEELELKDLKYEVLVFEETF